MLKNFISIPVSSFQNWVAELFTSTLLKLIDVSYWLLLIWCLIAILFYMIGNDSFKKHIPSTMLTYFLLQCLKSLLH